MSFQSILRFHKGAHHTDIGKRAKVFVEKALMLINWRARDLPSANKESIIPSMDFEKTNELLLATRKKDFVESERHDTQTLPPPHHTTVKERSSGQICHAPTVLFRIAKHTLHSTKVFVFVFVCLPLPQSLDRKDTRSKGVEAPLVLPHLHPPTYIHIHTPRYTQVQQAKRKKKKSCTL